jgi:acyl transferase domain-containing protein
MALSPSLFFRSRTPASRCRIPLGWEFQLCKSGTNVARRRNVRRVVLRLLPKDAALMDPQLRLFLEVCWEAFESAGYDPASYPGKVGVLSSGGGVVSSYLMAKLHHADLPGQTASTSHINNDKDFLSTRVSFKLNLRGPSFTIQSACSSSLVAVHLACQTLRVNECNMMLAGGLVVRVPQVRGYLAEKRSRHSLDGHCRPFNSVGRGTIFW